ncbi:hypothetical protein O6H91_18G003200 [Diphasiastrum complanatum]|uniref:Uncharacterized protein n=1 Tax=Diphasiastrum complanatum TaxID=34168 RepID=A0ACC2AXI7_DIPCM|nr:hypothetical protein O6H91_Y165800 [Diphasiastrum complanatum]KAJ7522250.1 hypothetical protein O6H91_18G003200 [Diphasiastrum complanatum]
MRVQKEHRRTVKPQRPREDRECPAEVALGTSDRAMPSVYVKALFAFRAPAPVGWRLEEGLSKVLCDYREWAGRIRRNNSGWEVVGISDEGVVVVEASTDSTVEELMPFDPSPSLLDLVPDTEGVEELLLIQLTRFSCQGLTVGVAWHHRLADGQGFMVFMNEWVRAVKGLPPSCIQLHDRSALIAKTAQIAFPNGLQEVAPAADANKPRPSPFRPTVSAMKIHFSVDKLRKLKSSVDLNGISGQEECFSTFKILTAHLWRCISKARKIEADVDTGLLISVDARRRLQPPLPDSYFGNVTFSPFPCTTAKQLLEKPISFAAGLIHAAIQGVDDSYLRSTLDFIESQLCRTESQMPHELSPNLVVASWARFPLYELDFGWGSPCFAGNVAEGHEGVVVLLPSYTRDGSIDAVVELFMPELVSLESLCFEGL